MDARTAIAPLAGEDTERVVLVDRDDCVIGTSSKMAAHRLGQLHRALSVFVFNGDRELLLQQRAGEKYHSGGLWSNTCCGHPRPAEDVPVAARRRLREEMGISCAIYYAGSVYYRLPVSGGLIEHEIDHVFWGRFDGDAQPQPGEVAGVRWVGVPELTRDLTARPGLYTPWLRHVVAARLELTSARAAQGVRA